MAFLKQGQRLNLTKFELWKRAKQPYMFSKSLHEISRADVVRDKLLGGWPAPDKSLDYALLQLGFLGAYDIVVDVFFGGDEVV